MRILSWNLFHGRSLPPSDRNLLPEFTERLAGWAWDVALLQEVPPWWPAAFVAAGVADEQRTALTSRNGLLPLRRLVAEHRPLIKSGGGGANAILVRGLRIERHVSQRVAVKPERRVVHGVRLEGGTWALNLHLTAHHPEQADAERGVARELALHWAGEAPVLIGGDFNRRRAKIHGFAELAHHDVDHVFARGLKARAKFEVVERGTLSDHAPIRVDVG